MKKRFLVLKLLSIFTSTYALEEKLPALIKQDIHLKIQMNICHSEWALEKDLYQVHKISKKQHLYFIPCSNWGYNTNWLAYFHVSKEDSSTAMVKPLAFIRYKTFKGIYVDNTISNLRWNPELLEITSFRSKNGTNLCGELAGHVWNDVSQEFKLKGLLKKDKCDHNDNWERLSLSWELN